MTPDLDLPRTAWEAHPHFPAQVLLLGSHENFRRVGQTLLERAQDGGDAIAILTVFEWWKSAMRNHERYEEHKLYPYLRHRFGIDTAPMEEGHDALAACDRRVRAEAEHGGVASEALVTALQTHQYVLLEHLEKEEDCVIPALLALTPHEFDEYRENRLSWLLREHLPVERSARTINAGS